MDGLRLMSRVYDCNFHSLYEMYVYVCERTVSVCVLLVERLAFKKFLLQPLVTQDNAYTWRM